MMGMMASLGSAAKVGGSLAAGWSHQQGWLGPCFYVPATMLSLSTGLYSMFHAQTRKDGK
jgi:hypothetical protein